MNNVLPRLYSILATVMVGLSGYALTQPHLREFVAMFLMFAAILYVWSSHFALKRELAAVKLAAKTADSLKQ